MSVQRIFFAFCDNLRRMNRSVLSGGFLIKFINEDQFNHFVDTKDQFITTFAIHGEASVIVLHKQTLTAYGCYSTIIPTREAVDKIIEFCLNRTFYPQASIFNAVSSKSLDKVKVTSIPSISFTLKASNLSRLTTFYLCF